MQIKSKTRLKVEQLIRNIILFTLIGIPSLTFCQLSFQLQDEMVCEPITIPNGSYYTITAQVKNIGAAGTYDFEMDFDYTWGGFITVVKKECSEYFNTNQIKTLTFDSNDPIDVTAGTYGVFLFVATSACADCGTGGGCYVQVADGLGDNPLYVTVTDEPTCTGWDVDPNYQSVPAAGGSYDAQVTTDVGGCSYNLTFNNAWIDFIGFTGDGYFDYSVEPNLGSARTGTISINNVTDGIDDIVILTIDQAAAGGDGPGEPESFSIEDVTSTTMYLNWSAPDDEGAGIDYYDVKNCLTGEIVATPSGSSCTISFLIPNTYYGFQVRTVDEDGNYSTYTDCDYEYTDPSPCELPSGLTETSVTTNSAILQWTDVEPDYNIRYKISGGATWTTTTSSTNSKSITGLSSNTTYEWQVESNCGADVSGYTSSQYFTTLNIPSTINITSENIPGWQRDNEPGGFTGSVSVLTTPPGDDWRLEVYKNGGAIPIEIYYSTGAMTLNFNSADFGIWDEGDNISYYAVHDLDNTTDMANQHTIIIDQKWDYENIVRKNDNNLELKIPTKYNAVNPPHHILVYRDDDSGPVAIKLFDGIDLVDLTIEGITGSNLPNNLFYVSNDGYCYLTIENSNIEDVLPGDFKVSIYSEFGITPQENIFFDFTKYGEIYSNNNNENILVIIGGFSNEMEGSVENLKNNYNEAKLESSTLTYSIAAYLENNSIKNYNVWYIAQGNANYIARSGYEIGSALEKIEEETNAEEIDIITHSKGGLDLRAFLQDSHNNSYSYLDSKSYDLSSELYGKIKKVLFLGTPHNGSTWATFFDLFIEVPGAEDLEYGSEIINLLNFSNLPSDIEYLNLAGYTTNIGTIDDFGLYDIPAYINSDNDGPVKIYSNASFYDNFYAIANVKQLYQHSLEFLSHFDLHNNLYLSSSIPELSEYDCSDGYYENNLLKILAFFNDSPAPEVESCPYPSLDPVAIEIFGSQLSGAKISVKYNTSEDFLVLGRANEIGTFSGTIIPSLKFGDTLLIEAPGYEILRFGIDSGFSINGKIEVPMIKTFAETEEIRYPQLEIVGNFKVSNSPYVNIKITAQNVSTFQINSPINQDSIYTDLEVTDDYFEVYLDTGRNHIKVKLIGEYDTIVLNKTIFYYPTDIINNFTNKLITVTNELSKGSKVYLNNEYLFKTYNTSDTILVFNGFNEIELSKFGFKDTVLRISTDTILNLSDYLVPNSYSSLVDEFEMNFENNKIQYWKNITIKDSLQISHINVKQYTDLFDGLGLSPKSRKFELNLLSIGWSELHFVSILDQFENLFLDSIYLLQIYDDINFNKINFDSTASIAGYDTINQKLSFKNVNFNEGTANKESFVIMKKQAPIILSNNFNLPINDTLKLPITAFFTDPDSIPNDLSIAISGLSVGLNASIFGDSILIYPDECWSGQGYITLDGTHDWLSRTVTDTINVINTEAPIIYYEPSLILCAGETITLSTDFTEEIFWSNGETTTSIIVDEPGNYFVGHYGECGLATSDTLVVILNNSPESEFEFSLDNLTTTFTNLSTDGETYLWDFGDGITSSEINALHTYSEAGSYYVTLTATNTCGISMFSDSVVIAYPNLIGSIEFSPSMIQYGDSLYVTVSITNDGESTAKYIDADGELEAFVNRIKISQDSCSFVTASLLGVFYTDSIQPGETITFSDAYYIDDTYAIDTFFILFIANAAEKVTEATFVDNQICSLPDTLFIVDSTCAYNLPVSEAFFSNIVSSGSFILNTLYDCNWAISSYAPWITITSDLSGSGTTEITFEIEENSACATRTGNIEISGQIFEVIQEGTESSYTLSSYSVSFLPSGGDGSLVVNATSDCNYYADCISSWVHFESGPYTNSTEFEFTVDPNLGGPRSTIVNIADTSFTIIQGPVGIIQLPGGEIKIYPNPVDGLVTIECSAIFDISEIFISNSLGQRIENIKPENLASCKYSYDLSNIANGNYWVNFIIEEEIYSYQIVVNH